MPIEIGIVGAGNRGRSHAREYADRDGVSVVAVADVDEEAATTLAEEVGAPGVYADYRDMLDDAAPDAVSVCVHNNLHRPITVDAADAGCHVFCEKPIAATYADAEAMVDAAAAAGVHLGVQNVQLFSEETRAARRLVDAGDLGDPFYARGVFSRRRGRPYVDGYGTASFVSTGSAGGGPILDIGTYVIGKLLYLLDNERVERVTGATFDQTGGAYAPDLVGDNAATYEERLRESGYDVEDAGVGFATLADGSVLDVRIAWHMFLPEAPTVVAGTQGGLRFDPFEFYTTASDYEATVSLDLDGFERRQGLLESETGYDSERGVDQFGHWIDTLRGDVDDPIPTGEIALNSMRVMEGIYLAEEAGRELTADEIAERSESSALPV